MTTYSAETEILVSKKTQGKTVAPHSKKAPKAKKPKVAKQPKAKKEPKPKKEGAAKAGRKAKYGPEAIGIGKELQHKMRDGKIAECKVTAEGFKVSLDGKDLGTHPTLGAAAKVTGQMANGRMYWGLQPYPEHKNKPAKKAA